MNIVEENIPDLNNEPPKFKKLLYPIPKHKNVQKPYFIMAAIGQRGSGKTFSIVRMLKNCEEKGGYIDPIDGEKVEIRHVLFSPTFKGNPVFTALKHLDEDDIINEYTEQKLYEVLEEIKYEREQTEKFKKYKHAYIRYSKMSDKQIQRCKDYEFLALLHEFNFIKPDKLSHQIKYPNGCVTNIILDDCLGGDAFNTKRKSLLVKAILNSRHYGINVIIAAQNLKSINKAIRTNVDIWVLFKFKSTKIILDDLYEEISGMLSIEEFLHLYNYATLKDNDAFVIDGKAEKEDKFKLNFDTILRLK